VTGPDGALEDGSQGAGLDPGIEAGRIHLVRTRDEQNVDTVALGCGRVAGLVPRVGVEILAGAELGGVDE